MSVNKDRRVRIVKPEGRMQAEEEGEERNGYKSMCSTGKRGGGGRCFIS